MEHNTHKPHARCWRCLLTTAAFMTFLAMPTFAQDSSPERTGVPEDWTHHHAAFGDAGTAQQAIENGTYDRWLKTVNDPRYKIQRAKRIAAARAAATVHQDDGNGESGGEAYDVAGGAQIDANVSQDEFAGPRRGLTKASDVARLSVVVQDNMEGRATDNWQKFPAPPRKWQRNGAKLDWSETLGSGGSLGLGNFPAKYSFLTSTGSCSDWVVYGTGLAGSTTQATIIGYTNLYSTTCSGSVPTISWAFNTGTGSTILTSPVLSLDGTQIAFVQNGSTGGASLVVLKWATGGTLAVPTALTSQTSGSAYRSCTAPCMISLNFSGGANDSGSSAWYDYTLDEVWVGDDSGVLHKFTGVFAGSPTEVTSGGWPTTVSTSPLSGPVRDGATGNVFVGDYDLSADSACTPSSSTSTAPCGFVYSYNSSTGALNAKSAHLDYNFGIVDTPLVDQLAGQLYVAVGSDGEAGATTKCGTGTPCAAVFQLSTSFTSGANGTETTVGAGYEFLLSGILDNAYYTSANAASPTGHMYVVGNTGPANNTLYQISISANVMNTTAVAGPVVALNYTNGYFASGLNVTEFFNGTTDSIFLSTLAFSNFTGCGAASVSTGCVVGFNITSGSISGSTAAIGSSSAAGGASGIVIDNAGSAAGESNIYFSALSNQTCATSGGSSGCAIQISQSTP